jgi:alpha-1,3-rhamnosyl/mannosyltransferase
MERDVQESLVLAGKPGWGFTPLLERIRDLGLDARVRLLGHVPQELMPGLLGGARLFVYPSLAEGFGFPPLEAMACGVPTISSDSTSLRENLEGAAELIPPRDATALTEAMARVLDDERLRKRLRDEGLERARLFRWEQTALDTLACYRELGQPGGSI